MSSAGSGLETARNPGPWISRHRNVVSERDHVDSLFVAWAFLFVLTNIRDDIHEIIHVAQPLCAITLVSPNRTGRQHTHRPAHPLLKKTNIVSLSTSEVHQDHSHIENPVS